MPAQKTFASTQPSGASLRWDSQIGSLLPKKQPFILTSQLEEVEFITFYVERWIDMTPADSVLHANIQSENVPFSEFALTNYSNVIFEIKCILQLPPFFLGAAIWNFFFTKGLFAFGDMLKLHHSSAQKLTVRCHSAIFESSAVLARNSTNIFQMHKKERKKSCGFSTPVENVTKGSIWLTDFRPNITECRPFILFVLFSSNIPGECQV